MELDRRGRSGGSGHELGKDRQFRGLGTSLEMDRDKIGRSGRSEPSLVE